MRQRAPPGRGYLASMIVFLPSILRATNPWEEAGTLDTLEGAMDKINLRGLSELLVSKH